MWVLTFKYKDKLLEWITIFFLLETKDVLINDKKRKKDVLINNY